ncbi:DNA-binding response regulator [Nocardioides immobilis]|uniref:DNA-binding response regulator n=1 Tax=Nocardioides immobilis TaxID=2049295 RepID=A0A417Y3H3_9ACTN|nr:response regulator transcription factor [Nocardioides immobilis]RHW27209.1 DNA-binding response regulator [Nocardioides immobilis]
MIRVLVVDDQALVRDGRAAILESEPDIEVVGAVDDGSEVLTAVREGHANVVLMDIRMPGMDGIAATRQLLEKGPAGVRVLMLTTFDLDEYLYEAMKAGASGFLLKDTPRVQLLEAVRRVAAGDATLSPTLVRRLVDDFVRRPAPGAALPASLHSLTSRETEVLRLLATGMSNAELASALFLSQATVRTHIAHIFEKLGLRDRVQAVVLAYESGLVAPGEAGA